jgi:hypothetical protein
MDVPDLILHALLRQTAITVTNLRRPEFDAFAVPLDPILQDFGDTLAWLLVLGRQAEPFLETFLIAYAQEARQEAKTDKVIRGALGLMAAAGHSTEITRDDVDEVIRIIESAVRDT